MRNIKLIALDLDGTLLNMEKKVPQGNYQALKECEKAGIQIVPATGRGVGGIPPMIRELPGANYAITTNGAVVADLKNNKAIKTCGLSNEMIQRILNIAKKYHSATDPFIDGTDPGYQGSCSKCNGICKDNRSRGRKGQYFYGGLRGKRSSS